MVEPRQGGYGHPALSPHTGHPVHKPAAEMNPGWIHSELPLGAGFNAQSRVAFSKTPYKAIDHQVYEDNKTAQDKLHARRQAVGIDDRRQIMLDEAVCIMIRIARPP